MEATGKTRGMDMRERDMARILIDWALQQASAGHPVKMLIGNEIKIEVRASQKATTTETTTR